MTGPWAAGDLPPGHGASCDPVTLIEGSTFCISEQGGDILPDRPHGLFVRDTRVLSRWELRVDGIEPQPLTVHTQEPFAATFLGRMPPKAGKADSSMLVVRRRYVGDGMREDITLRNTAAKPKRCVVALAAEADFADLFEVKGRSKPRTVATSTAADASLVITSGRRERRQELRINGDESPSVADGVLTWRLLVPAQSERTVSVEAVPVDDGVVMKLQASPRASGQPHPSGETAPQVASARPAGPHGRPQPGRGAQPQRGGPGRAAHLRSRPSELAGGRSGRALVHGAVRPGLAADRVDAAAVGSGSGARDAAHAGSQAGRRGRARVGGGARQDPARGAVRARRLVRSRRSQRLLRLGRRVGAVRDAAGRAAALGRQADGDCQPGAACRPRAGVDRGLRRRRR